MAARDQPDWTIDATLGGPRDALVVRGFVLTVVDGPGRGRCFEATGDGCQVGSHASNDLTLEDAAVSRFHCEVKIEAGGPVVRDLGSRNGTRIDGVRVAEGYPKHGSSLRVGRTTLRFEVQKRHNHVPAFDGDTFGSLYGESIAMRTVFAQLERAAAGDLTVLLEGETGTGKGEAAEAVHRASRRADGPFVVVDCGAIPALLLDSELFGHEAGAFTGATHRRIGAFESATGGTVFLDEIGELPLSLQPRLLRVLERREVQRVGGNQPLPVDIRIVAATHRDLRREVTAERFRDDLYYRLAVLRVVMPPLRERPEDIAGLVDRLSEALGVSREAARAVVGPEALRALGGAAWPGNVRELRNYLERCFVFEEAQPLVREATQRSLDLVDARVPYAEARRRLMEAFEESYARALLEQHAGNVSRAARAAGMARPYLHRLLRRYGIERPE